MAAGIAHWARLTAVLAHPPSQESGTTGAIISTPAA